MHAPLKGSSPIPGVPLTRVAQQYAPALCAAWGLTVNAAFQEWHWEKYLQERLLARLSMPRLALRRCKEC